MKKELIKTDNYLLVVDDSEIKEGDWMYLKYGNTPSTKQGQIARCEIEGILNSFVIWQKVIAHLPINDSADLKGVPLLPPLEQEDDVEKLAEEEYPIIPNTSPNVNWDRANKQEGFERGYNKAREKYKFTEEDAKYFFDCGRNFQINAEITFTVAREYLSKPKTPTHFDFTMDTARIPYGDDGWQTIETGVRTTTNSQGQTVACGKYLY